MFVMVIMIVVMMVMIVRMVVMVVVVVVAMMMVIMIAIRTADMVFMIVIEEMRIVFERTFQIEGALVENAGKIDAGTGGLVDARRGIDGCLLYTSDAADE